MIVVVIGKLNHVDDSFKMEQLHTTSKCEKGWPKPLTVLPSKSHTHSIILLHGRGSNASRFGLEFLESKTSTGKTLQECFPSVKFIFPTAKKRRAAIFKRMPINQWFDIYSLEDPAERQDLQYDGLRETTEFIGRIVMEEAAGLTEGVRNVLVGGLSQGCAMALIISLSFIWSGSSGLEESLAASTEAPVVNQSLAGFIGMSGWLPFAGDIASVAERDDEEGDDDDPFQTTSVEPTHTADTATAGNSFYARQLRASNYVRDLVDLAPLPQGLQDTAGQEHSTPPHLCSTPYFLGHGTLDEKVSVRLGQESRAVLSQLGLDVTWAPYDEGHWYKVPDELDDIASFLRDKIGIPWSGD
ncbi:hypothetical protein DV738_g469, partial [Chaetothyriales sp. CBS 135597]